MASSSFAQEYKKVFDKQSEKYLATMDKCLGLSAKKKESALIEVSLLYFGHCFIIQLI